MKLKQLKMSGFKSFVDPTNIPFKNNITGVVGPNGCGKSNVIDAVKWVLGENSAKNLRSDLIANVIFSGSANRKPSGQASVELLFDNSSGKLTGEYHSYNEISIKRVMSADGNSSYYLNSTRCRRKDITDVFLGTGLGPRSYSIIEQGIISKFVEAKPEDLRIYIEEAAGISKYKERRRETNNKIKSTEENLSKINSLKDELSRQLEKIKKQAKTAEKYKSLKAEEQELRLQLLSLKWVSTKDSIQLTENKLNDHTLELESAKTSKESIDTELVLHRENAQELQNTQLRIQEEHYKTNSEIAKIEQSLKHNQDRSSEMSANLEVLRKEISNYTSEISEDMQKIDELNNSLLQMQSDLDAPLDCNLDEIKEIQQSMESQKVNLEEKLSSTIEKIVQFEKVISLEKERITQFASQRELIDNQRKKLLKELDEIDLQELLAQKNEFANKFQDIEHSFSSSQTKVLEVQSSLQTAEHKQTELLDEEKVSFHRLQDLKIELATLEAEQRKQHSDSSKEADKWLKRRGYDSNKLLRETLQVESGWELAIEAVLADKLQAVCLDEISDSIKYLDDLYGNVTFINAKCQSSANSKMDLPLLLTKIVNPNSMITNLLQDVYIVDNLSQAHNMLSSLSDNESLVTKEGIWLHKNWIRVSRPVDENKSVIAKQKNIDDMKAQISQLQERINVLSQQKEQNINTINETKNLFDSCRQHKDEVYKQKVEIDSKIQFINSQIEKFDTKQVAIKAELQELEVQLNNLSNDDNTANNSLVDAKEQLVEAVNSKESILEEKQHFDEQFAKIKEQSEEAIELQYQYNLKERTLVTELKGVERNVARLNALLEKAKEKEISINSELDSDSANITLREDLEKYLNKQLQTEEELHEVQQEISTLNELIKNSETKRFDTESVINEFNNALKQLSVELEHYRVKHSSLEEQASEMEIDLGDLKDYFPQELAEKEIASNLQGVVTKIERLGTINLTAIDEYNVEKERYEYYSEQSADLEEALNVLITAIRKIDAETKTRFKSTYTTINDNFKALFPKLFGGGKAELYLTEKSLLDTGVGIVAKPPGKRVANISSLSGGEKAMTAVALVLSIFKLNPSPFCLLDEVDAPLDDANVMRFCEVIKEMSKSVQFIVITHNKLTMEMTEQLSGVTMQEPGVSRIVSVDIEEAINAA